MRSGLFLFGKITGKKALAHLAINGWRKDSL